MQTQKKNPLAQAAVQHQPSSAAPPPELERVAEPATPVLPQIHGWRGWWLAQSWPWRRRWGRVLCALNRHDWEHTVALDEKGEPHRDENGRVKPSDLMRCKRLDCRIYRGALKLVQVGRWLQTDDFMVMARADCPQCYGRGYARKMILDPTSRAKMPCPCLRVQPLFVERVPAKERKGKK